MDYRHHSDIGSASASKTDWTRGSFDKVKATYTRETSPFETGKRISNAEMLKKLGDQWDVTNYPTQAKRDVSIFRHEHPEMLEEKDENAMREEHLKLAALLDVSSEMLTPIKAPTAATECFGDTLARGQGKMHRVDAEMVLQDNFKPVNDIKKVKEGDVLAIRYDKRRALPPFKDFATKSGYKDGQLLHLGRVSMVDHSESPSEIWAESTFGERGKYGHEPHHLNNIYGSNRSYYRPLSGDGSIGEA